MKTLPTYYYLTHFNEFLDYIEGASNPLLTQQQRTFIADFKQLDKYQQCLLVRVISRKSGVVRRTSLYYEEIQNIEENINSLLKERWLVPVQANDLTRCYSNLTKAELSSLVKSTCAAPVKSTWNKAQLLVLTSEQVPFNQFQSTPLYSEIIMFAHETTLSYFLFLYFGESGSGLEQLSMRDLGILKTQKKSNNKEARFDDIEQAQTAFKYRQALDAIREETTLSITFVKQLTADLPCACGLLAEQLSDKLYYRLGKALINDDPVFALHLFAQSNSTEAHEKWIRLAYKTNPKDEVEQKLQSLIDNPPTDAILTFAQDFYARKFHKKRTSILTDMLRECSQTLVLDDVHKGRVERAVIEYYERQDLTAWRTENTLWRSLFGLLFWDELFNNSKTGLSNEFDRIPKALKFNTFYLDASSQIESKLRKLTTSQDWLTLISKSALTHYGKNNFLFQWHANLLPNLTPLFNSALLKPLRLHLLAMCKDWHSFGDGYPDIMVQQGENIWFEEIKAEGDQLRRNQLLCIQQLKKSGFEVSITSVNWQFDAQQPYVVVDIETTGGRKDNHRITEIGMQKIINYEVVEEWQSLINPQRHIPAFITQLTGITNEMVSNAPLFSEVAEQINEFTQNTVFVAHNVNFDYGFIKTEFERLSIRYKRPKLCTVREMRKYFPSLPSYSLANLTKHFGIDMQQHHRAMSDTKAASKLLNMINKKREENILTHQTKTGNNE